MLDLTRTWAVMAKEMVQLTRDRLTYAMILVMPIVQLLLFGYAINTDPKGLPTAMAIARSSAPIKANGYAAMCWEFWSVNSILP